MGRRALGKQPIASEVNGDAEEKLADSESRPQPIDLGDMAGLKRCLDDCALNVSYLFIVLDGILSPSMSVLQLRFITHPS